MTILPADGRACARTRVSVEREGDRQRQRLTDRQTEIETDRQRHRDRDRQRHRDRQRQTETHREPERDRDRERNRQTKRDRETERHRDKETKRDRDKERASVSVLCKRWTVPKPLTVDLAPQALPYPAVKRYYASYTGEMGIAYIIMYTQIEDRRHALCILTSSTEIESVVIIAGCGVSIHITYILYEI